MSIFTLRTFGSTARPGSLEAHLIDVARRWAAGKSLIKVISLEAFRRLLERESKWYCKDHQGADPDSVLIWIGQDPGSKPKLLIQGSGAFLLSALIEAKVQL